MVAGHPRATTTSTEVADGTPVGRFNQKKAHCSRVYGAQTATTSTRTSRPGHCDGQRTFPCGKVGAMMAVGDTDPTYPGLLEALKQARSQAQVRPVGDRIASTESFLERAKCSPRGGEGQRRFFFCRDQVGSGGGRSPTSGVTFALFATGGIRCGEPTCHSSRQFHAGIGTVARTCSGSPAGKRRFAFRIGRSRQPRWRRWSLEEVTQISVRTFSGSFDAFAEPSDHSRGKWPEPFIDDGDGRRSCKVHDQVWPAVDEFHVSSRDSRCGFRGSEWERLLTQARPGWWWCRHAPLG